MYLERNLEKHRSKSHARIWGDHVQPTNFLMVFHYHDIIEDCKLFVPKNCQIGYEFRKSCTYIEKIYTWNFVKSINMMFKPPPQKGTWTSQNPSAMFEVPTPIFFFKKTKSKGPIDSKILVDQNLEVLVIWICWAAHVDRVSLGPSPTISIQLWYIWKAGSPYNPVYLRVETGWCWSFF